jgi:hypothetical protein
MNNYIINSFLFKQINTIDDIINYVNTHSNTPVTGNDIQKQIKYLIKTNILVKKESIFSLSSDGKLILKTNTIYYQRILKRFFRRFKNCKTCIKYFELREKRLEQNALRNNLIKTNSHKCILCDKKLPLCLLETAHIKPRFILKSNELYDIHIAEFMCRYCHTLYDNGLLAVKNGTLQIASQLTTNEFDLSYPINKEIAAYNLNNSEYFDFHFKHIFKH